MKFLIDESADTRVARPLRQRGLDVTTVAVDHAASLDDIDVLAIAHREQRILIADDCDFGELIFRDRRPHAGVHYFRQSNTILRYAWLASNMSSHTTPINSISSWSSAITTYEVGRAKYPSRERNGG